MIFPAKTFMSRAFPSDRAHDTGEAPEAASCPRAPVVSRSGHHLSSGRDDEMLISSGSSGEISGKPRETMTNTFDSNNLACDFSTSPRSIYWVFLNYIWVTLGLNLGIFCIGEPAPCHLHPKSWPLFLAIAYSDHLHQQPIEGIHLYNYHLLYVLCKPLFQLSMLHLLLVIKVIYVHVCIYIYTPIMNIYEPCWL